MNAYVSQNAIAPVSAGQSAAGTPEEQMRVRLFDQFNNFWINAVKDGVPYDMVGTMTVTAAIYGLLAKHGAGTTVEFLEGITEDVRSGLFSLPRPN
ncbi:hypothetical protein [Niveispirillum fermenti]|uniref:hypothetical protein n=1 Tax=Niveispirillum fermenti TaxID=1233113 RepID=UPI003A8B112D